MTTVEQRCFWDKQQRIASHQEKNPARRLLADSIPCASFRPLLDKGYAPEPLMRKRIDPVILFKMLVLQ
jgi:hypothetical protein